MKPLIAAPVVSPATIQANMPESASSLFRADMFDAIWWTAIEYGIDPVGMVAQSAIETNWGTFYRSDGTPSNVQPWFHNTCGIKVLDPNSVRRVVALERGVDWKTISPDHPLVHAQFPTWELGAVAQAQHLRAYAGLRFEGRMVDPRWVWVWGKHECRYWEDLSGKWAGPHYGTSIEAVMDRLLDL